MESDNKKRRLRNTVLRILQNPGHLASRPGLSGQIAMRGLVVDSQSESVRRAGSLAGH